MTPPPIRRDDDEGPDRRQNGDWMASLPIWSRAVAVVGIPGAIAIFLVWVGAQELPKIKQQTQLTLEAVNRTNELLAEHARDTSEVARMLQRICSNTARNDEERARCFDK
jgi:hypothetical protein